MCYTVHNSICHFERIIPMKQLFSFRNENGNRTYEGDTFVTKRLEDGDARRLRELEAKVDAWGVDSEYKEAPLTPMHYVLIAIGVAIIGIMIYLSSTFGSLDDGFEQSPALIAILGILCIAAVVITVIDKKKRLESGGNQKDDTDSLITLSDELDKLTVKALDTLGIETDEEGIDVITLPEDTFASTLDEIDTVYFTVFCENGTLVLSDYVSRYEFKISDFKKVEHIETPLLLCDPVKPVLADLRREYGVKEVKGRYRIPSYDCFTVSAEQGDYTLLLPNYDGKLLAHLIGIDYEEG